MPSVRNVAVLVAVCAVGVACFIVLFVTMLERQVPCLCADQTPTEPWVSGWERDDAVTCSKACRDHRGGVPDRRGHVVRGRGEDEHPEAEPSTR